MMRASDSPGELGGETPGSLAAASDSPGGSGSATPASLAAASDSPGGSASATPGSLAAASGSQAVAASGAPRGAGSETPGSLAAASGAPVSVKPSAEASATRGVSRWRLIGAAVREIELLADLAREAHMGRVRVPLDELERAGVEVSSLAKPPWPASLATFLRERHEALRGTIAESVAALGREEQAGFRGLLVWVALAWRQSVRAQRALPGIISPRRYHALTDGWQAWRAARQAAAGKLRLS
jgi:hypothetical protein